MLSALNFLSSVFLSFCLAGRVRNRDFSAPRNQGAALWMKPEGGISAV